MSLTAIQVSRLLGQQKLKTVDIDQLLSKAGDMCDLSNLQLRFKDFVAIYNLVVLQSRTAKREEKQAFTYIDFKRQEMLRPWLNEESVGGDVTGIAEKFKLATDKSTSSIMALHNGINKAIGKTCFLRRKA